jgi:MYXO-CTERM domain-containing protein
VYCARWDGDNFGGSLAGPEWSDESGWDRIRHYSTLRFVDVDGDGADEACANGYSGTLCASLPVEEGSARFDGPAWGVEEGWDSPAFYTTIQMANPRWTPDEGGEDAGLEPDVGADGGVGHDAGADAEIVEDTDDVETGDDGPEADSGRRVETSSSCAQAGGGPLGAVWGLVILAGIVLVRRRA